MTARESILTALRASKSTPAPPPPDVVAAAPPPLEREALTGLFCERMREHNAVVVRTAAADIAATVADHLSGEVIAPVGLPRDWLPAAAAVLPDSVDSPLTLDQLAAASGALTGCRLAIASTGTLLLDGGAWSGRRVVSLWPDLHVCVLRSEDIVAGVPEAIAAVDPRTGPLTLVSGPSATSDIEFSRVEGVHGPRRLVVVVVDA